MSNHQLIVIMLGFMIGLVLPVHAFWGFLKWIEYRDMTRVERMTRKWEKNR
jgi:hypothetical protein